MTSSASMAQRLAKIELLKARQQISLTLPLKLTGLQAQAGDIVKVTNTRLGWTEKTFEVESVNLSLEKDMGVDLALREIASNVYDWDASEEQAFDASPNTTLTNPFASVSPTVLTTNVYGTIAADGTYVTNVQISWTASTDAFFDYYEVKVKLNTDTNWTTIQTKDSVHIVRNAPQGTYDIEVYTVNFAGVKSAALTGGVVVGTDTTAPAAPSGLTITSNGYQSAYLKWTNPTDFDFFQTIIYASTTNDSSTANEVGRVSGTSQTYSGLTDNTTYYVWLKAVDYTGNISGFNTGQYSGTSFSTSTGVDSDPLRNAQVYFFYNTAQASAPTAPTTAEVAYNFATSTPSISTSGWSVNFSPSALSSSDTGSNKYWAVKVVFQETVYNGAYDEVISSVFTWMNFDGLVTFTNLANGQDENGSTSTTLIDGGSIQTNTLTADKIAAGSTTVATGKKFALGSTDAINNLNATGYFERTNAATSGFALAGLNSGSGAGAAGIVGAATGGYAQTNGVLGFFTNYNYTINYGVGLLGNDSFGAEGRWYAGGSLSSAPAYEGRLGGNGVAVQAYKNSTGQVVNLVQSGWLQVCYKNTYTPVISFGGTSYSAYSYQNQGPAYFYDGVGPFTGIHDGVVDNSFDAEVGDILVDVEFLHALDVSNTILKMAKSTSANQKGVIGVFVKKYDELPFNWQETIEQYSQVKSTKPMDGLEVSEYNDSEEPVITIANPDWFDIKDYKVININGLGEGMINVCGQNGDIEIGDLIVTSNIPGKGMKQDDDIVRSYTVAKARDSVTFASPDEVKQVACIYVCG
jgi:hypothetical protein